MQVYGFKSHHFLRINIKAPGLPTAVQALFLFLHIMTSCLIPFLLQYLFIWYKYHLYLNNFLFFSHQYVFLVTFNVLYKEKSEF